MFSPTTLLIGIYREMSVLNLINTYTGLILVNAAFNLAFAVWILSSFFRSIPKEIEEAAQIDGCSKFQAFRKVALPLALPGIVTTAIFIFIAAWNEFVVAYTLASQPAKQRRVHQHELPPRQRPLLRQPAARHTTAAARARASTAQRALTSQRLRR